MGDDLVQFPTDTHARAAEVMIEGAALITPPWHADVSVQDARNNLLDAISKGDQAEIDPACNTLLVVVGILSAH